MGKPMLSLDPAPDEGLSLAEACAAGRPRPLLRIDDTWVDYDPLPEVPVQRPGPPIRHEPPLPGEEDAA